MIDDHNGSNECVLRKMHFVKLVYDGEFYNYLDASNIEMNILGDFLTSDVGCYWPAFMDWALNDWGDGFSSNITFLRKENGKIFLRDLYPEEDASTELEMTVDQYVQILKDWRDKVCKLKPKEVMIKHEHGEFIIQTKGLFILSAERKNM